MPTLQFKGKNIIWNHPLSIPYHTLDEVENLHFQPEKANGNLIIEGDNLLALKALLPHYTGKIKCIYIDPPYNTGNEHWAYNDNVNSPMLKEWFGREVGKDDLTRHDKWLCMMVPRLKLLRELLSDDGVIFISIDDNELQNLINICYEVFGEDNYLATFTWVRKKKGSFLSDKVRKMTEFVVCFQKNQNEIEFFGEEAYSEKWQPIVKRTNSLKKLTIQAGIIDTTLEDGIYEKGLRGTSGTNLDFIKEFRVLNSKVISDIEVTGRFVWTQEFLDAELNQGTKISLSKKFGFNVLRYDQDEKTKTPSTLINGDNGVGTNEDATQELSELFNTEIGSIFSYSKPVSLIRYLVNMVLKDQKDSIILDSFAGSGTTMHAVMDLNKEDGGNRKCIMIQMTEATEAEPDKNICKDITSKRIKCAIEKYGYDSGFQYFKVGIPLDAETILAGNLPTFMQFAEYVYYLCTGESLKKHGSTGSPSGPNEESYFVGEHGNSMIYLVYKQDFNKLTHLALNLTLAEEIIAKHPNKKIIVYAPACFLEEDYMKEKNIDYVGIPYNLFQHSEA